MKQVYIYDIETYKQAFILCAINRDTGEKIHFEISKRKNEVGYLLKWLREEVSGLIGFNNIEFDWPVVNHIFKMKNSSYLVEELYNKAQTLIKNDEYSGINNPKIPQLDLYRIWHFNNKARATSLKWIEFYMRLKNIEDLPYKIDAELTDKMIEDIIQYCYYDCEVTDSFYKKSIGRIELRKKLEKKYKIPLLNRPDVGIAEDLILDSYCRLTNKNKSDVRQLRSEYDWIRVKDVLLPCIEFKTEPMKEWLESFKDVYLKAKGGHWKGTTISLFDEKYDLGLGGIHIQQKSLAFYRKEDELITEKDCASLYPTIISKWGFYPKHLGKEFLQLYTDILNERLQAKKDIKDETDIDKINELDLIISTNKLILNGLYGKLGSDLSFMYDLKMLYSVTINNQLMMLMLIEQMGLNNIKVISANTDSITTYMKKSQLELSKKIEKEWQDITRHMLEDTEYDLIVYRDVDYLRLNSSNCWKLLRA